MNIRICIALIIMLGIVSLAAVFRLIEPAIRRRIGPFATEFVHMAVVIGIIVLIITAIFRLPTEWLAPPLREATSVADSQVVAIVPGQDATYFVVTTGNPALPLAAIRSQTGTEFAVGDRLSLITGELNPQPNQLLPIIRPKRIEPHQR